MIRLLIVFLLVLPGEIFGYDIRQIHLEYFAAVNNQAKAEQFYLKLKKLKPADPLLQAYYGSAQAVRARYALNPYNKITYLKGGLRTLNSSVVKSPANLEIRFLRFSLQHYIPPFLGMNKHLNEDKKQIIELVRKKQYGLLDSHLLKNIVSFMKESKRCSAAEIAVLNKAVMTNG